MRQLLYLLIPLILITGCKRNSKLAENYAVLEVEGRVLYQDELNAVIPVNSTPFDSTHIADRYIKNWITQVLMYENAKRNIGNQREINRLVEEYRQSLIIHEFEQALVSERIDPRIPENDVLDFFEKYKHLQKLDDNLIKGILLIVPDSAPQIDSVREWVRLNDNSSLEKIEKYSLQNAISYDYFLDKWTAFSEISKKMPLELPDSRAFVLNNRFAESNDSTRYYFLRIVKAIPEGESEPYEYAKERIANIILNKRKADFITSFEKNIYDDAIRSGKVNFYNKKK